MINKIRDLALHTRIAIHVIIGVLIIAFGGLSTYDIWDIEGLIFWIPMFLLFLIFYPIKRN